MSRLEVAEDQRVLAAVEALGVSIDLVGEPDTAVSRAFLRAWRDAFTTVPPSSTAGHTVILTGSGDVSPLQRVADLTGTVTLTALDATRGTRLLLHAAGIAAPDGSVLTLVGPSGRGKTTAARHLGRHFGYVSDESVAVDEALTVWSYRKPLSVIVDGQSFKEQIAPSDLGLRPLPDAPLHLAGITLLDRDPDADGVRVDPVDLIDAICEMTPQISYLPELPSPLQYVARIIDEVGPVTRLVYRDAVDLPAVVEKMFTTPPPPPQAWSAPSRVASPGPWRCAEVDDAILVEGRACILRAGVVTALDHRGCLVWTMCREGATTDEIARSAVAAFGAPEGGDARALIEETIEDLRRHGLLEHA